MLYSPESLKLVGQIFYRSDSEYANPPVALLVVDVKDDRGLTGEKKVAYRWRGSKWNYTVVTRRQYVDLDKVRKIIEKNRKDEEALAIGKRPSRHQKPDK